jgi:hypothetical protein
MSGGGIAVHCLEFSCQNEYLLKVFLYRQHYSIIKILFCKHQKQGNDKNLYFALVFMEILWYDANSIKWCLR